MGRPVYRFEHQTLDAAMILKTGRYVSGLHAGQLLLDNGFLQELGTLQRSLSDFSEDATFLALARISNEIEDIHRKYLTSFWEEDPDYQTFASNPRGRDEVPRSKIQSHLSRSINGSTPDHQEISASKYLSRLYSGYVHGAAPNSMDMYNPIKNQIEVSGSTSAWLREDHTLDFQNYLFRGVVLIATVAHALGDTDLGKSAMTIHDKLKPNFTSD